jgi:hypothetical protein
MGDVSVVYVFGNELLTVGENGNTLAYTTGNNLWLPFQNNDTTHINSWQKIILNQHINGLDNMPIYWIISLNGYLVLMSYDLWYSADNGSSWIKSLSLAYNQFGNDQINVHIAKAAINNKDVLYASPLNFQKSLTSGVTWELCNIIKPFTGYFNPKVRGFTYNKDTNEYIIVVESYYGNGSISPELISPVFKSTDGINFTNFGSGEGLISHNDLFNNPAGKYVGSLIYDNGYYVMISPEELAGDGQPQDSRVYYTSIDLNLWERHITPTTTINGNYANTPVYAQIGMLAGSLYTLIVKDHEAAITDNYIVSNNVQGHGFSLIINHTYNIPQIMPSLEPLISHVNIIDSKVQTISNVYDSYFWSEINFNDNLQITNSTIYVSPQLTILYNDIAYQTISSEAIVEVKTVHLNELYFIEKIFNKSSPNNFYHTLNKLVSI